MTVSQSKPQSSNIRAEMMTRRRVQLEDGRYLIFFWFGPDPKADKAAEQPKSRLEKEA
jgi:hypothetical protein